MEVMKISEEALLYRLAATNTATPRGSSSPAQEKEDTLRSVATHSWKFCKETSHMSTQFRPQCKSTTHDTPQVNRDGQELELYRQADTVLYVLYAFQSCTTPALVPELQIESQQRVLLLELLPHLPITYRRLCRNLGRAALRSAFSFFLSAAGRPRPSGPE